MRIYAVADIHGKPKRLSRIKKNVECYSPDALVAAGDITHFVQARQVLSWINGIRVPVIAVRGNTDLPRVEKLFDSFSLIHPVHLKTVKLCGTTFTGISGTALLPFRSLVRYGENSILRKLRPLLTENTVLVAHPPPLGTLDKVLGKFHTGSPGMYKTVTNFRPSLLLCGHIHERAGTARIGKTTVVNCTMGRGGEGAVIDIENGRVETVNMIESL